MKKELILKKCLKCNNIIEVINRCNCSNKDCKIMCCNEPMQDIIPNSQEASIEKHIPNYEIKDNTLIIKVNHVMEEEHYIEWIMIKTETETYRKHFLPNEKPELAFKLTSNAIIYSYCNKHGLWKKEIKGLPNG